MAEDSITDHPAATPATSAAGLPTLPDAMLPSASMSPALQIMLHPVLFERAKDMARYMSQAEGFLPRHLIGKPAACFAVLTRAITWKLDPYAVAQSTFQIPGSDKVGYEGKLIAAILENSGKLDGGVRHEYFGPWENVTKKRFTLKRSDKGKEFAVPGWTYEDAVGCGITIRGKVKGELEPREYPFELTQAFPLNSTLWATDPRTQLFYTAVRRFASVVASGLLMGVPWEGDYFPGDDALDITPRRAPRREEFAGDKPTETAKPAAEPAPETEEEHVASFSIIGVPDGEVLLETEDGKEWARLLLAEANRLKGDKALLDALWENNSSQIVKLGDDAQAFRDAWPKFEKPGQTGLKV